MNIKKVILETQAHKDGRALSNETLKRVRVDDKKYRDSKQGATLETTLKWLKENNFVCVQTVMPKIACGTVTVKRFYEKEDELVIMRRAMYAPGEQGHRLFNGTAQTW